MDKKIMVVDDDPDILICMRTIFEREGYEVLTIDSGKDCITELERGFKGVVLLDIMMPFMDGWETLKQIVKKGLTKDIKISIITARGRYDQDRVKDLQNYIYSYIPKPFDAKKLVKDINSIISS